MRTSDSFRRTCIAACVLAIICVIALIDLGLSRHPEATIVLAVIVGAVYGHFSDRIVNRLMVNV